MYKLPNRWRPQGLRTRELKPGIDLPCWFLDGIKAVDTNLYFVWHPYRVLYEGTVMNQYSGTVEDSRYTIGSHGGEEVWGYILTDGDKRPILEETWHCWRLCDDGWAHVFEVGHPKNLGYLKKLLNRLHLQARITEKYGYMAYAKYTRDEREKQEEILVQEEDQLWHDTNKENKWLMNNVMENFKSGKTAPTRPQKDVIASYKGQVKRSKITRDITDEEGGLILPEKYKKNG
jgi:hypothetical protein